MIRVCVLWKHPLFHDTIRSVLHHPEIEIIGAPIDDVGTREQLNARPPDIVIFEQTTLDDQQDHAALEILGEYARVIRLSLDDNILSVYTRHNHTVEDIEDLLSLVLESQQGTGR